MLTLVAAELAQAGFITYETSEYVKVYLDNRKVSKMEVEIALEQIFEGIQFSVISVSNGVIVRL